LLNDEISLAEPPDVSGDPLVRDPGIVNLSPFLGPIYPPSWRGRYPHLMPVDLAIWNRFMDKYAADFVGFQYDVTVGEGAKAPEGASDADKYLLWSLTVKRIDCLGIRKDRVIVFEVKPRLGMAAIGQMVSYYVLWLRQYGRPPAVQVATVCEQSEPDLEFVAAQLGFLVIVV